jgi:polyhydroxyalkanoate synthesis regulator phasin
MNKKMATAGLAAGLLAGTGAGLILQMSGSAGAAGTSITAITEPVETTDTTATDTAADATTDAARAADREARLQEVLKPLVDDGTLTQAQADSVVATFVAAGPIGGGGHGGPGGRGGGPGLSVVATTLGMTEAEVRDAISNGQTLAQLAEAKGSTAQALIDAILADHKTHLDEKVAAGELTQAEADAKLAEATTRITEFVNNTDASTLMGPGGPGGRGPGGRGPRGDAPGDDATDTTDDAEATATN